jgi:hypothetical protein
LAIFWSKKRLKAPSKCQLNSKLTSCGFAYLNDSSCSNFEENVAIEANFGSKFQKRIFKADKACNMDACII